MTYNIGRPDNTEKGPNVPYTKTALGGGNTYNTTPQNTTDSIKTQNEKTMEYIKELSWRTGKTVEEILENLKTHH